jgi:hypothetical protein
MSGARLTTAMESVRYDAPRNGTARSTDTQRIQIVDASLATDEGARENVAEGGESACWLHLVCDACGAILSEGHRQGCEHRHTGSGRAEPA